MKRMISYGLVICMAALLIQIFPVSAAENLYLFNEQSAAEAGVEEKAPATEFKGVAEAENLVYGFGAEGAFSALGRPANDNSDAWLIYRIDESVRELLSFTARAIKHNENAEDSTLEFSADGTEFSPAEDTQKINRGTTSKKDYIYWDFTCENIPEGTRYVKVHLGKTSDKKAWRSWLAGVAYTYNSNAELEIEEMEIEDYLDGQSADSVMGTFTLSAAGKNYGVPIQWGTEQPELLQITETEAGAEVKVIEEGFTGYACDAVLTVSAEGFKRNFPLTLHRDTSGWSDEDFIAYDFSLFEDFSALSAQPSNMVYSGFVLPDAPAGGSSFKWSLSDKTAGTIDEKNRVTFNPSAEKAVSLDLILTAVKGSQTQTKKYPITLIQIFGENALSGKMTAEASSGFPERAVSRDMELYWQADEADALPWIIFTCSTPVTFSSFLASEKGTGIKVYSISVSDDGVVWNEVYRGSSQGDGTRKPIAVPEQTARYIKFSVLEKGDTPPALYNLEFYASGVTPEQIVEEALKNLDVPSSTAGDLTFPAEGADGTVISWDTDRPDVISRTGKVTRQKENIVVTVTAAVTKDGYTAYKTFHVKVTKKITTGSGGGGGGGGASLPYRPSAVETVKPVQEPEAPSSVFADVTEEHWAYPYIESLADKGVISGDGNAYHPEDSILREEFLKMIVEAAGIAPKETALSFTDVDEGEWYYPYVMTAYQAGIIQGVDDQTFGIGQPVLREDMAVMTARVLQMLNLEKEDVLLPAYADAENISNYARTAVMQMAGYGIMNGDTNQMFLPRQNATRAESAKIIAQFMRVLTEQK